MTFFKVANDHLLCTATSTAPFIRYTPYHHPRTRWNHYSARYSETSFGKKCSLTKCREKKKKFADLERSAEFEHKTWEDIKKQLKALKKFDKDKENITVQLRITTPLQQIVNWYMSEEKSALRGPAWTTQWNIRDVPSSSYGLYAQPPWDWTELRRCSPCRQAGREGS